MLDIRPLEPDQFDAFHEADSRAFLDFPSAEHRARARSVVEFDRALVAWDGDTIAGGAGIFTMQFAVPGGFMPAAGITGVFVQSPYRRRGLMTRLMRAQFDRIRDAGEPLAALAASESHIYGRFGFGVASWSTRLRLDTRHSAFRDGPEPAGSVRHASRDELFAAGADVWERAARNRPGTFRRPASWWPWRFVGDAFYYLYEEAGRVDGYVVLTAEKDWDVTGHHSTLHVQELLAAAPAAYRALWRLCLDIDLVETVSARGRPPDEPLFHLLMEPRRLRRESRDGLWARLVDVPACLAGRSYATPGALVFDVRDEFLPDNAGRYLLEAEAASASACTPTARPADIEIDVGDLGAALFGGARFTDFARAGRATAHTDGALAHADAMFTHQPAPWCPQMF